MPDRCLHPPSRTRFRRAIVLALLALPTLSACLGVTQAADPEEPWEGTWVLVRIDGQPLPFRRDSLEVTGEDVRLLNIRSGFARDYVRVYANAGATTGAPRTCQVWFTFVVTGANIGTSTSLSQQPSGSCAPAAGTRTYVLDGDTLRSQGGPAFTLGAVSRAYVRAD